jgi:hypothetical protein
MQLSRSSLMVMLALAAAPSMAAEVGIATLVDGNPRVLRAVTWYKLVPGARLEDGDIVEVGERAQLQAELNGGSIVNLVDATAYFVPPAAKVQPAGVTTLSVPRGWLKIVAKAPGLRIRAASSEVAIANGAAVVHTDGARLETFVEAGTARFATLASSGAEEASREGRQDEFYSRSVSGAFVPSMRPPKAFVDALPRHFLDPLPALAARFKSRPQLAGERDVSYAEAQPWLAGRDRAVFERRFTPRLKDPVFRRAVEPDVAGYPSWDRRLHPEKYAPPPVPKPATSP